MTFCNVTPNTRFSVHLELLAESNVTVKQLQMKSCNSENYGKCEKIIYIIKCSSFCKNSKPGHPALTVSMYRLEVKENKLKFKWTTAVTWMLQSLIKTTKTGKQNKTKQKPTQRKGKVAYKTGQSNLIFKSKCKRFTKSW